MSTKTEICNLAMAHLGVGKAISDLDTDASAEAEVMRRFYTPVRQQVLRDFDWPFASTFITLTETAEDPTTEWGHAYEYPDDCIKFRRILSGVRSDYRTSKEPYRIVRGSGATEIYADVADAVAEITVDFVTKDGVPSAISAPDADDLQTLTSSTSQFNPTDVGRSITIAGTDTSANDGTFTITEYVSATEVIYENAGGSADASPNGTWAIDESVRFPPDFAMAFSLRLAIDCAPRITGGDNGPLVQRLYQMYYMELDRARANAMNETGWDLEPDSEFIRVRS